MTTALDDAGMGESDAVEYLDALLAQAYEHHASDVHIAHGEGLGTVHWRVQGCYTPLYQTRPSLSQALINRLKCLSQLDMTNTIHPQEGAFRYSSAQQVCHIRVSTCPTVAGEHTSLRFIYPQLTALSGLGLNEAQMHRCLEALNSRLGLIVVSGPTGAGKSTTLHAMLHHLKDSAQHIVSIEDPVEQYTRDWTQLQCRPGQGLDSYTLTRTVLRQDPDILMIGEVRDAKMADCLQHAAESGHLVLTSCHANDPMQTLQRLTHLGFDPQLLKSLVRYILTQRWMWTPCNTCHGKGCNLCQNTGQYRHLKFTDHLFTPEMNTWA